MKRNSIIGSLVLTGILLLITYSCGVKDKDGNTYKTVKIGDQEWMVENLMASTFRNGDSIPQVKTNEEWENAGKEGKPAWCYYANDPANDKIHGKLYNWYAMNDSRGIAPEGWHVPSDDEWTQLVDFLGGGEVAGAKLKSTEGWIRGGIGTNETGFTATAGGSRGSDGVFSESGDGTIGCWWSTTEAYEKYAWTRYMSFTVEFVYKDYYYKELGFSIRCLKD